MKAVFTDPIFPGAKIVSLTVTVTNTSGSYNNVFEDDRIIGGMQPFAIEIANPEVFGDDVGFTCTNGAMRVTCSDVSGSTSMTVRLLKIADDPTTLTSAEFDILNSKLNYVEQDFSVTIPVNGWSVSAPYIYTWTNSAVADGSYVDAYFLEGENEPDIESFEVEKVSGGVKFTVDFPPSVAVPVCIRVINRQPKEIVQLTGDMVATSAISGAVNVNEALSALNSNFATGNGQSLGTNVKIYRVNNMRIIVFTQATVATIDNITLNQSDRPSSDYYSYILITNSIGAKLIVSYIFIRPTDGKILPRIAAAYNDGGLGGTQPSNDSLVSGTIIYFVG